MSGELHEAAAAARFILAGNARVTLMSKKTGTRFTYRVRAKEAEGGRPAVYFVSVLTGSNNDMDFEFLGTIFEGKKFVHSKKSRIGAQAPSAAAFQWTARKLLEAGQIPEALAVFHEGRCGKCGRPLTVPESIESGLGPVCAAGGTD